MLAGCGSFDASDNARQTSSSDKKTEQSKDQTKQQPAAENQASSDSHDIDLAKIPKWNGKPSIEINGGEPAFSDSELNAIDDQKSEDLASLDSLGRCGEAVACVSDDTMPDGERGSIGMIKPAGWHLVKYDFVEGKYLYNRCHLIGWQLTGLNAEERNLITGTRYLNTEGMLPYENQVADYIENTGRHVAYRVEPVYKGDDLIARGVHIEAESIEDKGDSLSINVYCYNVQPNVDINYATGESSAKNNAPQSTGGNDSAAASAGSDSSSVAADDSKEQTYILNTNTKRYHLPGCRSLSQMKDKNKRTFTGAKKELDRMGYKPCGNCNP